MIETINHYFQMYYDLGIPFYIVGLVLLAFPVVCGYFTEELIDSGEPASTVMLSFIMTVILSGFFSMALPAVILLSPILLLSVVLFYIGVNIR